MEFDFGGTKGGSDSLISCTETEKFVRFTDAKILNFYFLLLFSAKSPISADAIAWLKMSILAVSLIDSSFFDPLESNKIHELESPGTRKTKLIFLKIDFQNQRFRNESYLFAKWLYVFEDH